MSTDIVATVLKVKDHPDELKEHPVGKFVREYQDSFDSNDHTIAKGYHHPTEAVYVKADGSSYKGEACFAQIQKDYAVFSKVHNQLKTMHIHESQEVPGGYEVLGTVNVLANLVGNPVPGEPGPIEDQDGNEWDVSIPGAFTFTIEKSEKAVHDGMFIVKSTGHSDSGPAVIRLLKRGVLKPSDIGM